jgi:hypothetical protein
MKKISTSTFEVTIWRFFVSANCGSMAQGQIPALFHIQLKERNAMKAKTERNNIPFSEYPVVKRLGLETTDGGRPMFSINKLMVQNGAFLDFFPNFFYHDFIIF